MAEEVSPTVARRSLRLALREAREHAGKTQQEVADRMEWSPSKVIRIENGDVTITVNDVKALLTYLGVKDRATVDHLAQIAKIARTRQRVAWYQQQKFRETLTVPMQRLIEYEGEAAAVRFYYVNIIPGPLQTPEYATALAGRYEEEMDEAVVSLRLQARQARRQTLLQRAADGEVDVMVLLDESVFMRTIGGPATQAAQLRELEDLSRRGAVKLRMVGFDSEAAVTNNASFDLITLPDSGEVLYRETGLRDEIVEDKATTSRHRERYDTVWPQVTDENDTIDFLRKRINTLEANNRSREG